MKRDFRATRPAMRVLFTSGYSANVIAPHGVLEREIQFLEKPYAGFALSRKVREVLDAKV